MSRFFRWKWLVRLAALMLVLGIASPLLYRLVTRSMGQSELDRAFAKLDAEDPGWQLDDLVAATNAKLPPDDQNPTVTAAKARDALPEGWMERANDLPDFHKLPSNHLLSAEDLAKATAIMEGTGPALQVTRKLLDQPATGGVVIVMPSNPLDRDLEDVQRVRRVASVLQSQTVLEANAGKPNDAVRSVRAGLALTRAVGDEPSLIGQLVRIALGAVAGRSAERVLALGEPDEGLAELQAEFLREAESSKLLVGLRGERASVSRIFGLMESGEFTDTPGTGLPTAGGISAWAMRTHVTYDWATSLDILTRYINAAKLPPEQRQAAMKAVPQPPSGDIRTLMTQLLLPAAEKVTDATLRIRGELSAVAVGIACERYRRQFGQWPSSLDAIPKSLLASVPGDPFGGRPLQYKRFEDGVVVYSIGPDGIDNGGSFVDTMTNPKQRDFGIRLYDVAKRRLPAPPKPLPEPEPESP